MINFSNIIYPKNLKSFTKNFQLIIIIVMHIILLLRKPEDVKNSVGILVGPSGCFALWIGEYTNIFKKVEFDEYYKIILWKRIILLLSVVSIGFSIFFINSLRSLLIINYIGVLFVILYVFTISKILFKKLSI
jgi:hypothetical protein